VSDINKGFIFDNTHIGFRVDKLNQEMTNIIIGIFLSSFAKYYIYMISSTWSTWHDNYYVKEIEKLPIKFPEEKDLEIRICGLVNEITKPSNYNNKKLLEELDKAIFDLYELSEEQRDLVRDFCNISVDLYNSGLDSDAHKNPNKDCLKSYCKVFNEIWDVRLYKKGKCLDSTIYYDQNSTLHSVTFKLTNKSIKKEPNIIELEGSGEILKELKKNLRTKINPQIYIDRILKEITDDSFLIIKKAEMQYWTKSQARKDAKEFLTEVFKMEWENSGN